MSFELKSTFASLPKTSRGNPLVINGDPKGKNFLYCNGTSVIIRDIENPAIADIYTGHAAPTTCAMYSPSGFYIASGDKSGKVRIWDTVNKEHILKNEFQPFSGPINDIAWTFDSQRICVVGEGRQTFGHVFNADTGASVGDFLGHSKVVNSVAMRPARPFRMVSASDDQQLVFFHGVPFKFAFTMREHSRFVNSVRYAPNGDVFISGGADGKSFIYDGKSGELKKELGSPAHSGGIYAVSFSPDSRQVLTVSADKTAKVWNVETASLVQEYVMGNAVGDMQVGCLWQGDHMLTVSLSGCINYLDVKNPTQPWRILKGHNKPITALCTDKNDTIYTGSSDGQIAYWNSENGQCEMLPGSGHSNQVQDMVVADGNLLTVGMDDKLMINSADGKTYGQSLAMPSQPRGLSALSGGLTVVACINEIVVLRGSHIVFTQKAMYEPSCVSVHPGMTEVAVGGSDNRLHLYNLAGDTLTPTSTCDHTGAVLDVKYSPDGSLLVACDSNRRVALYDVADNYKALISSEWTFHTARVNSASWTEDSSRIGTGSLDTSIIMWDPVDRNKHVMLKGAHPMSQVTKVRWLDNHTLVSVGQDSNVKQWKI